MSSDLAVLPPRTGCLAAPATVNELCDRYQAWADEYYQRPTVGGGRRPTQEAKAMREAMRGFRLLLSTRDPRTLTAEDLYACQQWMVEQGLVRTLVNARINRIRRVLAWAAKPPRRWITSAALADFKLVDPLRKFRSSAREADAVEPVSWELVSSTLAVAPMKLATMIELQWWTGMRPGEVCRMRREELTRDGELLLYKPAEHKTQHYGIERIIAIGPFGQGVLLPWLRRLPANQSQVFGITTNSYRQAVERVNRKHKLKHWYPLQIRHSFATRVERDADEKLAQKLLGHTEIRTTRRYIEPDVRRALEEMKRLG